MKRNLFSILKCILLLYLILTVLVPIVMLFSQIRIEHIKSVITSVQFLPMLKNSIVTTLVATVISTIIAFVLAYVIHRTNVQFKSVWIFLFTIPMLIPSISHGMGLVLLFGDNGILTNVLGIQINLYGYCGLIMGSVL